MRFNPCGMAVAMLRRPYQTTVRPFRDSSQTVTLRWYRAPPGHKTLPFSSAIQPLLWDQFPERVTGVGEVWPVELGRTSGTAPAGVTGQHWCGTREDFRSGCEYRPDLPPVRYTPDGAALCYLALPGGVVLGGSAPTVPHPGAVALGGTAPVLNPPYPPVEGGIVLTGEAPVEQGYCGQYVCLEVPAVLLAATGPFTWFWPGLGSGTWALEAPEETGTPGLWRLTINPTFGLDSVYEQSGWDGHTATATFDKVSGLGVQHLTLACGD